MNVNFLRVVLIFIFLISIHCKKEKGNNPAQNHAPLASLSFVMTSSDPLTLSFTVVASDADHDPLTYNWDFGNGTVKSGSAIELQNYEPGKSYIVKVSVTDSKSAPVVLTTNFSTGLAAISIDESQHFQAIEGFGGFGAKDVYWSSGPFTSSSFVNDLINDLGLTILRDDIPTNFEIVNDNNDPNNTDLTQFNLHNNTTGHDGKLDDHLQYLKDMKAAGLNKLIVSVWSPAPWMKTNNNISNGTSQNSAPAYNPSPGTGDNQLRTDMYAEFAEMCVAYIKIIKQETGIDVYALSIQNEPRFSQSYASCVYDGAALRDLLKVVGKRFSDEGLSTRLFLPEDVGWFEGADALVQPIISDPISRQYVSFIATHGYAFDGVTASSTDAQTWGKMSAWGSPYGKELWMTETSGFSNDFKGAMDLAKAMYTALNFGNISAWLFWALSTSNLDGYCLMRSDGTKSKRYFVSKNFYHFIRPGATRVSATASGSPGIYPLAFLNNVDHTVVLINDQSEGVYCNFTGQTLPSEYEAYVTSVENDCKDVGKASTASRIFIPANSVLTLFANQ